MSYSTKHSIAQLILSFVGALIAGTLWWAHRNHIELPCSSSGGCDLVNASSWSHVALGPWHDIPIALIGLGTYFVLLTLTMVKFGTESNEQGRKLTFLAIILSGVGSLYSWFLQYVSHFNIGAFCPWCFSSACIITLYCIVTTLEFTRFGKGKDGQAVNDQL